VLARSSPDGIIASLPQAVEASCAVPGLYAPVRVGGRRLVDGGVQSVTNLDLAIRTWCRTVIALSPMGFEPRRPPDQLRVMARQRFNNQLRGEAAAVRHSGASLLHLRPTGEELQHHGYNMLSLAGNDQVMRAAYESTARRLETASAQRVLATIEPARPS
jgi:NTE family protein